MEQTVKRILIVDDNEAIHEDIHNILDNGAKKEKDSETEMLEQELFGTEPSSQMPDGIMTVSYTIDDAYQGNEAILMVEKAAEEGFPYALIFMDVRMPPGMDGIQAITEIWKHHPQIEMVICTAYSDYSWDQIVQQFGSTDNLLFMKKPFDSIALRQTALLLTSKWDSAKRNATLVAKLEADIQERTRQLKEMSEHLQAIKKNSETLTLAKNKFFMITSELQTPLNGILGITDLLLDTDLNQEQRSFAETIKMSGNSLLLVINDILDVSKAEMAGADSKDIIFDLRTALESVVDLVGVAAMEKAMEITCFVDCQVNELFVGDPFKLRQILLISFMQIIKTEESCELVLSVTNHSQAMNGEAELLFEVKKLESIHDEFAENRRIFRGFRFDLLEAIAQSEKFPRQDLVENLVKQIDGEFYTDSHPVTGAVIRFTGRFGISKPTFPAIELSPTLVGLRCLIISDNPTARKILSLHIDHWGGTSEVADVKEDIAEIIHPENQANLPFETVIIDLKSESIAAYGELAGKILQVYGKPTIDTPKLICLTANAKRGDAQEIESFGYSAYLSKPVKQSQLYKALILVKSFAGKNQFLSQPALITKHYVDEFTPDFFKVLVLDKNQQHLKTIITCFSRLKVRCDVADNSQIIPTIVKDNRYDLLLIDSSSCLENDAQILKAIQKEAPDQNIVLMAEKHDSKAKALLDSGQVNDLVLKPVNNETIVTILKQHLTS